MSTYPMRLIELLDEYAARKLLANNTKRLHAVGVRQFSRMLLRNADVADFSDANLARYAERGLDRHKAAASVNGEQCKLIALWRFAAREGYIAKWPTIKPVKMPARVPLAWTREELGRLFAATAYAKPVGRVVGPLWWRALFFVLFDTGERIEAAMSIEWDWVDLDARSIHVPAEVRKGQTTDRFYKIAEDTAEWIGKLPREYRHVFFWPYCHGTLYNHFKRMLVLGGLPAGRKSKFHRIRKSTASHYEAAGGNATEFLGHTSRKCTKAYIDPRIVSPTQAVDLLFRPGG